MKVYSSSLCGTVSTRVSSNAKTLDGIADGSERWPDMVDNGDKHLSTISGSCRQWTYIIYNVAGIAGDPTGVEN